MEGEVGLVPINVVNVSGNDVKQLFKLMDLLEEHEDIQKVYSNFDIVPGLVFDCLYTCVCNYLAFVSFGFM